MWFLKVATLVCLTALTASTSNYLDHLNENVDQTADDKRALVLFDGGTTDTYDSTDIFLKFSCVVIALLSGASLLGAAYFLLHSQEEAGYGAEPTGSTGYSKMDQLTSQYFTSEDRFDEMNAI